MNTFSVEDEVINSWFHPDFYVKFPLETWESSQAFKLKEYRLIDRWYNQQIIEHIEKTYLTYLLIHYKFLESKFGQTQKHVLVQYFLQEMNKIKEEKKSMDLFLRRYFKD